VSFFVAHGVEMGRWEPLPGVFRLVELGGPDWFEIELAADGIVVEP
jgi:hypothetical protein